MRDTGTLPHPQYDLLHLFIGGVEFSDEDQHHLSGVIAGILSIHERDQVADSFEESSQTLEFKEANNESLIGNLGFVSLGEMTCLLLPV